MLFVGVFGAWASYAPLASAAIASGVVSPESSRKTIQHLEGGIVEEILVKEGDRVEAGAVLMRLAPTQARANFAARQRQYNRYEAERLRLQALEQEATELVFPVSLTELQDADFQAFLANQKALFVVQQRALVERTEILARQVDQLHDEISAIQRENDGLAEQVSIIEEEIVDKQSLLDLQLTRKPELMALTRLRADLKARIASNEATISRAGQRIEEVSLSMLAAKTEFQDHIAQEIVRVNSELAQLEEALTSTGDIMTRTEIRAPVSGTVLNLQARTIGGIVQPGEPILDIVPAEDALVVEARLSPNDIDAVAVGQSARVHLTPYSARDVPALQGRLTRVSPDSTYDEATRQSYFAVRVEVETEHLSALTADIELTPGMPAEVFILTGEQSLFGYFAAPVVRSFRRAFREE